MREFAPSFYDAQVGVNSYYRTINPASNEGTWGAGELVSLALKTAEELTALSVKKPLGKFILQKCLLEA